VQVTLTDKDALIVVDVQTDFCPDGALAVPHGDEIVPALNRYLKLFDSGKLPVFATRDWHPEKHISFKEYGGIWPPHCIRNTDGAKFHPGLNLPISASIISKATNRKSDAYSGFQKTKLKDMLKRIGIKRVFIGGLATDYCVKNTVLDALRSGFVTFLLADAIKGVDINPGDSERAIDEMLSAGAVGIAINEIGQL